MGTKTTISFHTLIISTFLLCFASCKTTVLTQDEVIHQHKEISNVLYEQQNQWNNGNIDKFMLGYWNNDSLSFTGKRGVTKGWQNTLDNYKKSYPDEETMGTLSFEIIEIRTLTRNHAFMTGKFMLERKEDNPSGYFSLLWEKIDGQWLITADHTSS